MVSKTLNTFVMNSFLFIIDKKRIFKSLMSKSSTAVGGNILMMNGQIPLSLFSPKVKTSFVWTVKWKNILRILHKSHVRARSKSLCRTDWNGDELVAWYCTWTCSKWQYYPYFSTWLRKRWKMHWKWPSESYQWCF